ncbi:MAG TPA: VWA domain-containing protein [Pyrinomonadaceae bacterium]|nr:VWA domain-containing protein [Pyrinomonadaceae bacterium]
MRTKCSILMLLLCVVFVPTPRAQDPATPAGPLVGLSMIVTDNDNKGVNSIRKEQIHVFEEGIEQTIVSIEPDERPVDLVLALDSSGSLNRVFGSALKAGQLVVQNRRPVDQIALVRFVSTHIIEKVQEFTTDNNALLKGLDGSYLEAGQSAVVDALYVSAQYVAEHNNSNEGRRKVVVIITDGEDRASYYKESDLLKLLREQGVQVFVVGLVAELDEHSGFINRASPRSKAEKLMRNVAEESGGRVFFPQNKEQLINSTVEVILDLRAQFRIKYRSTIDASKKGFRKVDVKFVSTDNEKRKLVVPRGYYAGPPPPIKKPEKKS